MAKLPYPVEAKDPLSERLRELIDGAKKAGGGYAEFAKNVEAQGWASVAQVKVLVRAKLLRESMLRFFASEARGEDRFVHACVQGEPHRERWYDEETHSTWSKVELFGDIVDVEYHNDGRTTYHVGGPCGPIECDEFGEMM